MITIIVADDHPVVREGLVAILGTQPDLTVVGEAADGQGLLDLASRLRPDLALVDLEMPVLDGIAAIGRLRDVSPATRALVLTAFDSDERIVGALEAGARGYLLKGAPRAEIFAAIRTIAAGGSTLHGPVAARLVDRLARPQPPTITGREREVLGLLARGRLNKEIAAELGISERTVKFHVSALMGKLGAGNRTEVVSLAAQQGLVEL